jgi:hypothetical protein
MQMKGQMHDTNWHVMNKKNTHINLGSNRPTNDAGTNIKNAK